MAKYNIKYACGHREHEIVLFGKHTERDRKIEWYENNVVCPACYKAERADDPYVLEIISSLFGEGGMMIVISSGATYKHREALKQHGWRWVEYQPSNDFLGMSRPQKAWGKRLLTQEEIKTIEKETLTARLRKIGDEAKSIIGEYTLQLDNSPLAKLNMAIVGDIAQKGGKNEGENDNRTE